MQARTWCQTACRALAGVVVSATCATSTRGDAIPPYDGRTPDMSKPVQVFILLGQSNMLGFGRTIGDGEGFLEHAVKQKGLYPYLVDDQGNWVVRKDVRNVRVMNAQQFNNEWMTITGASIGPEIGIGWHLGNVIDAPVLILKSCIGNRSLGWDLLPPGSERFEMDGRVYAGYKDSPDSWPVGTEPTPIGWYAGKQYDDDIAAAKRVLANLKNYVPGATAYEVAGFFWWQGDKDMRNAAHSAHYEANLVRLIHSLRKDFDAPDAKFVAATLGQTTMSTGGGQGLIRDAKFALADPKKHPEFEGRYAVVFSNPLSKGGSSSGHYNRHAETYMNVGEAMGAAMAELIKSSRPAVAKRPGAAQARARPTMPAANRDRLAGTLRSGLAELSATGGIEATPLRISVTAASIYLKAATAEGTLTFAQVGVDRTAELQWDALALQDHATLAMLYAASRPDDGEAQAIAGTYMALLANAERSDAYFAKAGDAASAKWKALLNP